MRKGFALAQQLLILTAAANLVFKLYLPELLKFSWNAFDQHIFVTQHLDHQRNLRCLQASTFLLHFFSDVLEE